MIANWVRESITSAGTGDIYLNGTFDGFIKFSDAFSNTQRCFYSVLDGTNRESGVGIYSSSANTITRAYVFATLVNGVHNVDSPQAINISSAGIIDCMITTESISRHAIAVKEQIVPPIFLGSADEGLYVKNGVVGNVIELPSGANKTKVYLTGIPRDILNHASGNIKLELLVLTTDMAATEARLNVFFNAGVSETLGVIINQVNTPDNVGYNIVSLPFLSTTADLLTGSLEVTIQRSGAVEDTFTGSVFIGLVRFVYDSNKVGDVEGSL
jgi:hypothetical protein